MSILGLHHVTAICSDAQTNVDFYSGTLGLRVVKVTVNFDDPTSYHLYYGDATGSPGTLMTFFVWPGGRRGRVGAPQVSATAYAIDVNSLDFWQRRFLDKGVTCSAVGDRFGEPFIRVEDPDGLPIELIGVSGSLPAGYDGSTVAPEHTLRTFHSVTLSQRSLERTAPTLATMKYALEKQADTTTRYGVGGSGVGGSGVGRWIDVKADGTTDAGHSGAGTVHHVAFRVADDASEAAWLKTLSAHGLGVSPVQERMYFRSIYYREPGGVLFEIATDAPGMAIDEPGGVGTSLRLPQWYEPQRAAIVAGLPPFKTPVGIRFPTPA